jgi:hypothetical protein
MIEAARAALRPADERKRPIDDLNGRLVFIGRGHCQPKRAWQKRTVVAFEGEHFDLSHSLPTAVNCASERRTQPKSINDRKTAIAPLAEAVSAAHPIPLIVPHPNPGLPIQAAPFASCP